METSNINLDIFDGEAFCRAACWFDINSIATDCDKRIFWLGKAIDLKIGQLATTVKLLADRWNMTAQTTRARLKEFAEAGLISMERVGTALIITISAGGTKSEETPQQNEPEESKQHEQLNQKQLQSPQNVRQTKKQSDIKLLAITKHDPYLKAKLKIRKCRSKPVSTHRLKSLKRHYK